MVRKICDLNPATCLDLKLMQESMNNLETKVSELDTNSQNRHDKLEKILLDFIEQADKKYVTKENVKLVIIIVGLCVTVLGALFTYAKLIFPLIK